MLGGGPGEQPKHKFALIHDALLLGMRDYFKKLGLKKAILGLSGGIDSAVTAVLAARALGPENVHALLLPSPYSSNHSIEDARKLAENIGISYEIVPLENILKACNSTLQNHFEHPPKGIVEENLQARIRGLLLMAYSNQNGCILLNTSNKSEAAVGYGTLYGDMCGGLSVLGDVYKTEVYELAAYINSELEIIPENTIIKPPSAELRPDQKDSDSLPEYDVLDKILFQYIDQRKSMREIVAMGFEDTLVRRVLHLVNSNEFKRRQAPPILRVSGKAFGYGRRMPLVAYYGEKNL
jgi:NAD+ synthase (glutamine-hydrolysing)